MVQSKNNKMNGCDILKSISLNIKTYPICKLTPSDVPPGTEVLLFLPYPSVHQYQAELRQVLTSFCAFKRMHFSSYPKMKGCLHAARYFN